MSEARSMIGLLGRKKGMTQIFDKDGKQIPVTVIEVGPCVVTGLRTKEKHGYSAVQMGFGEVKEKKLNKPKLGFFKKSKLPLLRWVKELRTENVEGLEVGQKLAADNFEAGDMIDIQGVSVGRGFQGVVKRHHFKGGASKSHGSMFGRVPGSIGASSFPSRVVKGMRAAGHMGNEIVTIQNIKVVKVDSENNLVVVKGTVPGFEDNCLILKTAIKKKPVGRKWKVLQDAVQEKSSKKPDSDQKEVSEKASTPAVSPENSEGSSA